MSRTGLQVAGAVADGVLLDAGVTFPLVRPQAAHQIQRVLDLFATA
jgi:hypothetical protein